MQRGSSAKPLLGDPALLYRDPAQGECKWPPWISLEELGEGNARGEAVSNTVKMLGKGCTRHGLLRSKLPAQP